MMKIQNIRSFVMLIAMILGSFACSNFSGATTLEAPAKTETATPVEQPASGAGIQVINASSYMDSMNYYNVVGEIANYTDQPLQYVNLSISITDTSGKSILKDDSGSEVPALEFTPFNSNLFPGETIPFSYFIYIDGSGALPSKFEVSVKDYSVTADLPKIGVSVENARMIDAGDGDMALVGDLLNPSQDILELSGFSGALLNDAGTVLAANSTFVHPHYLYPAGDSQGRDRGQFMVKFDGPISGATNWKVYSDVGMASPDTILAFDVDARVTRAYFDAYEAYHLTGIITNNGSEQILPALLVGVYGKDNLVIDANSLTLPIYLDAGQSAPFDIVSFTVLDHLADAPDNISNYHVYLDEFWTYPTSNKLVPLEASDLNVVKDGSSWTVTGKVTNTSTDKLSGITIVMSSLDANGNVAATGYGYISAKEGSDFIAPGETGEFTFFIYAAREDDLNALARNLIVQGLALSE